MKVHPDRKPLILDNHLNSNGLKCRNECLFYPAVPDRRSPDRRSIQSGGHRPNINLRGYADRQFCPRRIDDAGDVYNIMVRQPVAYRSIPVHCDMHPPNVSYRGGISEIFDNADTGRT